MSTPSRLHEQALPILAALSRFWQFNRKKLVAELQGHIDEAQQRLDTLFSSQQQLITQCTGQSDEIRALHSRNYALYDHLQVETAKLASTNKALELEKSSLYAATIAQVQATAYAKDLEDGQTATLARIADLETLLATHKQQLADKEQTIAELQHLLFNSQQQLITQCTGQNDEIRALHSRNYALSDHLQVETAKLASTNKALEIEKSNLYAATLAQVQATAYAKNLEDRQTATQARIADLETHLATQKRQLANKEQTIVELQCTLTDVGLQLQTLDTLKQQLTNECCAQAAQIQTLEAHQAELDAQLKAEQTNLLALANQHAQALEQITELKRFLEDQRNQLASKEHDLKLRERLTEQLEVLHQQLEGQHADINKQHLSLTEKFSLVSKVLALQPPANEALTQFAELVKNDYMEFAGRESSLANEAQAVLEMQAILAEMQLLNNFPSIAGKTILSIAGGFSSGKSAFVNSYINHPGVQLPVGINPVTVVPSYVVCSEETKIKGYSYSGGSIDLDEGLYKSMCHEYVQAFGFDLRRILPFISVKVPMRQQLFDNLCIIDTPGYNPGASGGAAAADRGTASSLVNQASALVWVIGLDPAGTIDQSDIEFIESTRFRGESLYIVLNKADVKSEEDILQIMEQVADDLSCAGIEYAGMCAHSSTRKGDYPFKGRKFEEFLCAINRKMDVVGKVTRRLDEVFDAYKQAIAVDIEQLKGRKKQFDTFKLYALEVGGTALFERIDQAVPINEQGCGLSGLEKLAEECEQLRGKLKQSCEESLAHLAKSSFGPTGRLISQPH